MTDKPPPKDLKTRGEELAQALLDTLNDPGATAARAAEEAEHERDVHAIAAGYNANRKRVDASPPAAPARARSIGEMRFVTTLEPCPHCGAPTGDLDLYGDDDAYAMTGPCPRCATMRIFKFRTYGDPLKGEYTFHELGGRAPSEIIPVARFFAELDRVLPLCRTEPTALGPVEWRASGAAVDRAITCVLELLKFIPDGAAAIPESALGVDPADRAARSECYGRAWLEGERDRLQTLAQRYTADAPRIWAFEEAGTPVRTVRRRLADDEGA